MGFARVVLFSFLIGCSLTLLGQQAAHHDHHGRVLLPNSTVTPGEAVLHSKADVCGKKWGTDERHVTKEMKTQVYGEYGTAPGKGVCALKTHTGKKGQSVTVGCEVDHLVSRELGGADTLANLWPQPYTQNPGAYQKDWLENQLHKEVCAGTITLDDAQKEIKTDWYAAYLKRKKK